MFSVKEFEKQFPKLKGKVIMENDLYCKKFIMKETCKDLDCAALLQKKCIIEMGSVSDTFIGVYNENNERIVIFFDVEKNNYIVLKK
jgi:hypothetical protein